MGVLAALLRVAAVYYLHEHKNRPTAADGPSSAEVASRRDPPGRRTTMTKKRAAGDGTLRQRVDKSWE